MGFDIHAVTGPEESGPEIRNHCPRRVLLLPKNGDGRTGRLRERSGIPVFASSHPAKPRPPGRIPAVTPGVPGRELEAASAGEILSRETRREGTSCSWGRTRAHPEFSEDLVFSIARDGTVLYANPAARRILGFGRKTGRTADLFPREMAAALVPDLSGVVGTGRSTRRQYGVLVKGREHYFDTILVPVRGPVGSVREVVGTARDVTDRVEREEESRLLAISQMEDNIEQFMILNDRIRNPLQVIRSLIEIDPHLYRDRIQGQINLIDELVSELDRGWLRSQKVREYLIERHRHGSSDAPGVFFTGDGRAGVGRNP